jgi:hypothetical protein
MPVMSVPAHSLRSFIAANHKLKVQSALRAGKPAEIGAAECSFLDRHLSGQSLPRLPTELRIGGERRWQPSIGLGYGQPCEDESAPEICPMGPRREEPGSAYLKIIVNF